VRLSKRDSWTDWLLLGLWLGLMGLSKYTAVFFVVPVAVLIIRGRGFSFLRFAGFYFAVILAFVLISPVLVWNSQHDWISFRYQLGHVASGGQGLEGFFKSWAAQFALYSPFLWGFSLWGYWLLFRDRARAEIGFVFWTATVFGVFFLWSSWKEAVLPHWPLFFYLVTIPLAIASLLDRRPQVWWRVRGAQLMVVLTATLTAMVSLLMVTSLGFRLLPEALKEVGGWPQVMNEAERRLQSPQDRIVFLNWTYGSRALFYGSRIEKQISVLDDRFDQFDLWNPESLDGKDLWILQFSYDEQDFSSRVTCQSLSDKEETPVFEGGREIYRLILQKCVSARITSGRVEP